MINFKDIRETLSPEDVKDILAKFDVHPVYETNSHIVFPTCCHNLHDGSHKLYYYKNNHMFKCFTECDSTFDIIGLLKKMYDLREINKSLIDICNDLGFEEDERVDLDLPSQQDRKFQEDMLRYDAYVTSYNRESPSITEDALAQYSFDICGLSSWFDEGISLDAMQKFNISYDMVSNAIVIPHRDKNGKLIGIRGRFMGEFAPAKYMPLMSCGKILSHPLGSNLYGLYENAESIKKYQTVILFEAEKSVLKMESIYGSDRNFSVATCGNKITPEQIELLRGLGVVNVVLAFDKDYQSGNLGSVKAHYDQIAKKLSYYFSTSVMLDYSSLIGYKDSPVDKGKQAFEELFRYRYFVS